MEMLKLIRLILRVRKMGKEPLSVCIHGNRFYLHDGSLREYMNLCNKLYTHKFTYKILTKIGYI